MRRVAVHAFPQRRESRGVGRIPPLMSPGAGLRPSPPPNTSLRDTPHPPAPQRHRHTTGGTPPRWQPRASGGRWSEVSGGGPACRAGGHERNRPPGDRGSLRLKHAGRHTPPKLTKETLGHVREQQRKSRPPGRVRTARGTPRAHHHGWLPRASGGRWSEVLGGGPACRAGGHERNRPPGDRGSLLLKHAGRRTPPKLTKETLGHVREQQRKSRTSGRVRTARGTPRAHHHGWLPRASGGWWSEVLGGGPACRAGGHERNRPPGDRGSLLLKHAGRRTPPKLTKETLGHVREQQRKSRPPGRVPAFMSPGRATPALLLILHSGTRPDGRLRTARGTPLAHHHRWLPRASGGRWSEVSGGGPACRAGGHERNRPPGDRGSLRRSHARREHPNPTRP
ncbi:hypothetical protein RGE_40390 [Rubrivivax gelatinosus IL144]|uniref:Uncharacterized protein n=1 Tax=Rubrivivax gelatinosus (strain NBRC 100245 / IL144) TaxID=983917 RepID=I0HWI8_RUBGI|nr:hypothetical protein RGE_40390 [Rubrivivax gelatinosus IL144]